MAIAVHGLQRLWECYRGRRRGLIEIGDEAVGGAGRGGAGLLLWVTGPFQVCRMSFGNILKGSRDRDGAKSFARGPIPDGK